MLFNSITFLIFLPLVFGLYWLVPARSRMPQNLLVVAASYVFYGWWDWRFLILIVAGSLWTYVLGLAELRSGRGRKRWVWLSALVNLGILGYFKYFNFFIDQLVTLLGQMGWAAHVPLLRIILPVGISFYTFQMVSYSIDVYRREIEPTKDVVAFLAYVAYFPQLVAGPIERASNLLPQFLAPRRFDYVQAVDGCRQMLWGFFKKMVVADNCAQLANAILNNPEGQSGGALWAGIFFFSIQIYGDFSGYSDIAIGCSRLFGIRLMRNFAYPYFSRDIAEFWRRWHISLSTWFRDYLYVPLGGSRGAMGLRVRNTFAIFLVSGLWHGANWTFVAWGLVHACCFLPLLLLRKNRKHTDMVASERAWPGLGEVLQMGSTFCVVMLAWTFFRAPDIGTAWAWLGRMLSFAAGTQAVLPVLLADIKSLAVPAWILLLFGVEWLGRRNAHGLERLPSPAAVRWLLYYALIGLIFFFSPSRGAEFIYFQF
jgi:alginate O-acetyltransferase complex protein AlgI